MLRGFGFRVRKWYFDCVTEDGTAFIGYAAQVGIGPFRATLQSMLWSPEDAPTSSRWTATPSRLPRLSDRGVIWVSPRLGVRGSWLGDSSPIRRILLQTSSHRVEWRCHLPACDVDLECDAGRIRGAGYAEELLLRGRPEGLPLRELRWGRFGATGHHVVWIEWRGPSPLRLVVSNGGEEPAVRVDEREVRFSTGALSLEESRLIRSGSVTGAAFDGLPGLRRLAPRRWDDWIEDKWLSRGRLSRKDGSVVEGWAIHERVRWP